MPSHRSATLRLAARLDNLKVIREYVEDIAREAGFPDVKIYDLVLAVDEAATNILLHGYHVAHTLSEQEAEPGMLQVDAAFEAPALRVTLRDHAAPFDPTAAPDEGELPPLTERVPGGLGIYLMRKTMDEIHYRRTPDGWNELTLMMMRPNESQEG
jgi:serine/threonine-protein kinase RsbW